MKHKHWKHALALVLALCVVLGTGILNSGNWLHASEGQSETQPATEPATEPATNPTQAPAQGNSVTEQIVLPAETVAETVPGETVAETVPGETVAETVPGETVAETVPGETVAETVPGETVAETVPGETVAETVPGETVAETVPEEVLPAAVIPLTVIQEDPEEKPLAEEPWTTEVTFAEGEATASVTLPEIEGYITPELTVERTAETTALEVKATYHPVTEEEQAVAEALDPDRSVKVELVTDAQVLHFGDTVKLKATLSGYDNVNYTLQWRYSVDGETWHNCPNQTGPEMTVEVSETNYMYYWNVLVTITGLK